jgi:predicted dehydrogenase
LHGTNGCLDSNGGNLTYMIGEKSQEVTLPPQEFDPITAQMRHFADVINTGKESEIAGTKRAYEVMQIVDAGYRSAMERTRIEI